MSLFAICRVEEIPNRRARGFVLLRPDGKGGERPWPIFVLRWGKHILGYENACPHQGTRLDWEEGSFLDGAGTRIMCGKHGALFDFATGICAEGPCAGEALTPVELIVDEEGDICIAGVDLVDDPEADEPEEEDGDAVPRQAQK